MEIKIKRIGNGRLPEYKTFGSVGADCYARLDESICVQPGKVVTIPLGFAVMIPSGFEMQIRGRSGNARNFGVEVFNSPGTIDCDYRGEVCAILYNASDKPFAVNPDDRVAQAIVAPVIIAEWKEADELEETERDENGFGSTGKNDAEKFYEPFKEWNLAELELDKTVVIDHDVKAKFVSMYWESGSMHMEFDTERETERFLVMRPYEAFQRVTINGHRFGQELGS